MKTIIKESLKQLIADRYLLALVASMTLLSIIFAFVIGFSIHPSELQQVSHYSAFGVQGLYTDQWFYLIVFVLFELFVAALHSVISVKLLIIKGHSIAVMYAWLGIGILWLGLFTALAVVNHR